MLRHSLGSVSFSPLSWTEIRSLLFLVILLAQRTAHAEVGSFLNYALLTLPPKYLADTPLSDRVALMKELSIQFDDSRLDYRYGYLSFYSDSEEPDSPHASSMFYVKLLKRPYGSPLVFVHMQKPFNGNKPSSNQTFVLELDSNNWVDVSKKTFPPKTDMTAYFHPLRKSNIIEVAPWVGNGKKSWTYGRCDKLLVWSGSRFQEQRIKPRRLTDSGDTRALMIWPEDEPDGRRYSVVFEGQSLVTSTELKQKVLEMEAGCTLLLNARGAAMKEIPFDNPPRISMDELSTLCREQHVDLEIYSCTAW